MICQKCEDNVSEFERDNVLKRIKDNYPEEKELKRCCYKCLIEYESKPKIS